jgi:hypothetical protein
MKTHVRDSNMVGDRGYFQSTNLMLEWCVLVVFDLGGVYMCLGHWRDCIDANYGLIE